MKKIICLLFAFTIFGCTSQNKQFTKESLAKELLDNEKNTVTFQSIIEKGKGKTTVIEVWASWCSDCIKAMPNFKDLQEKNPDVNYVFISMDKTYEKWLEGISNYQLNGIHYWATDGMKGEFGKSIDLDWIPRYIIIDKTGKVVLFRAIEKDFEKMNEILKTLK
jgi:thiol-disulfide isomerase/thioredoxin